MNYIYGGKSDKGYSRTTNEDYIHAVNLDENNVLCIIADGAGSYKGELQPAQIAGNEIILMIRRIFEEQPDLFFDYMEFFLKEAILQANRVLGGFKMGSEEKFGGFAAGLTIAVVDEDGYLSYAHTGNTRLYLMEADDGIVKLSQITRDQTAAQILLEEGKIDQNLYYAIPERLKVYGGVGIAMDPEIETRQFQLKPDDIILMTTDGIHYAIRPDAMSELFVKASDCQEGVDILIKAALEEKYPDNASGLAVYCSEEE